MRRELPTGHRALELFALWSFAVAQPVLALVASSPDFFSERKAPVAAIVLFALVIVFVAPVLVLLLEAAVERARPGWGRGLHNGARLVLLWAITLQLLNWLDLGATHLAGINAPGWSLIFVAAIVSVGILRLLWRSQGARMSVRFLAMAVPVALVMFLISAPLGEAPGAQRFGSVARCPS